MGLALIQMGCSGGSGGGSSSSPTASSCSTLSDAQTLSDERAYCSTVTSYSGGVTITATAQYAYRPVVLPNTSGLKTGLGSVSGPKPIRYAEVEVQDSSGNVIQCGTTGSSGEVSVQVPAGSANYNLIVRSRADNSYVKASILNNTISKTAYSISQTFQVTVGNSSVSVSLPTAPATGTLEGGAFNILDQILNTNAYLRSSTACPSAITDTASCATQFTVAPKVQVFWTPGVSPGAYFNSCSDGISFFLPSASSGNLVRGLYIQGGIGGDVNNSDTDHFDNSVLIHEYGHFMEDVYSESNSPGGSHSGQSVIDSRLAWSEAWADFFQGAVFDQALYADTSGNYDGDTGFRVLFRMDTPNRSGSNIIYSGYGVYDIPADIGEGAFREVAIARTLWGTLKQTYAGVGPNLGFGYIWQGFASDNLGVSSSTVHHRSAHRFNRKIYNMLSTYAASSILDSFKALLVGEYQLASSTYGYPQRIEREYGQLAATGSSCSGITMTGFTTVSGAANYAEASDQMRNNDFFLYYNPGGASPGVRLNYSTGSGSLSTPDLDLYIYTDDYVFGDTVGRVGYSASSSDSGTESVSLSGLGSGYYLINVSMKSATIPDGSSAKAVYTLQNLNGDQICPQ